MARRSTRFSFLPSDGVIWALVLLLMSAGAAYAQSPDSDGDGVPDDVDACPTVDASLFDADGDGCPDATANARHVEYFDAADLPLVYVIHENGAPGIDDGSDVAAIQAAFDTWAAVGGTSISATFGGTTAQKSGNGLDGVNLVSFEDGDFVALFGNAVIAVGVTTSFDEPDEFMGQPVRPGQIVDADMLFNPNRSFTTDGAGTGVDLQAVAVHEAGHLFGLNHSAIPSATMFPALPSGTQARTLELDDEILAFMAYPTLGELLSTTRVRGHVLDGGDLSPVPGAAVFAIPSGSDDPVAVQYTLPDGSWSFAGLPAGAYDFYVHPLDGSSGVNGVVPGFINALVVETAQTVFLPEYYDAAESANDDPTQRSPVTLANGVEVTGIDVLTNVDSTPPTVSDVTPDSTDGPFSVSGVVLVRFDEPIDFDSVPSRFALEKVDGATREFVTGQLVTLGARDVLVFTPSTRLDYSATYELTLRSGILDRFGNATPADAVSVFSTEAKPPLSVTSIEPVFVVAGTVAVISGEGFDTSDPANNSVDFGGLIATGTSVSHNRLAVVVPDGIPQGPVQAIVSTLQETASERLAVQGTVLVDFARSSPIERFDLQAPPNAVTVLPDARWALAATDGGVEAVAVVTDGAFGTTVRSALVGGLDDIAVVPGGRRAYGVSRSSGLLRAFDTYDGGVASAPAPSFLQPEADLETGAEPLGVVVDPTGRRCFVSTASGVIQEWDIALGSATFHEQVGEIVTGRVDLRAPLAVDRLGEKLFVTAPGALYVYDLASKALLATVPVGSSPRGIAIAPQNTQVYVSDEGGLVSVVSLQTYLVNQSIDAEGGLRDLALSPTGGLGYVTDRRDDQIAVFDLREGTAAFRTVVAEFEVAGDPIDVVVAPDGLRTFSVHEGTQQLEILGIGFGPTLGVPYPPYAKPGDIVAFGGTQFAPYDSTNTGITSATLVDFGSTVLGPLPTGNPGYGSTNSSVWARVPSDFAGETIRVGVTGPAQVGFPTVLYTNPAFLRPFTPDDIGRTASPLVFARTFGNDGDLDWQGNPIGLQNLVHPRGEFMLVSVGTDYWVVGLDETRADFLKSRGVISNADGRFGVYQSFAPDGKILYTQGANILRALDMDLDSPTFGQEIARVDFSTIESQEYIEQAGDLGVIAVSPDGTFLMVYVGLTGTLYRVPLVGPQAMIAGESTVPATPRLEQLKFHPAGEWAYGIEPAFNQIYAFCLDTDRPDYLGWRNIPVADEPSPEIQDLEISPDGTRLFVLTRVGGLGGAWRVVLFDVTDPAPPLVTSLQPIGFNDLQLGSPTGVADLVMHPNGMRVVAVIPENRMAYIDVSGAYLPPNQVDFFLDEIGDVTGLGLFINVPQFTPDGRRLLVSEQTNTVIEVYDYASLGSPGVSIVSGDLQTGVAGQALPAPLRLRVQDEAAQPVRDFVVQVDVTQGGGTIDGEPARRYYVTDAQGYVNVNWVLGPSPDPTPGVASNRLAIQAPGIFLTPQAFSVQAPESVPLALVQMLPLDTTVNVGVTSTAQAVFSRAVDRSTVGAGSMVLRVAGGGATVPTAIGYADGDRRVTLIPLAALSYSTDYEFVVSGTIADRDGNVLGSEVVSTFGTQAAPPPTLSAISPPAASVGTQVTLVGAGFDPVRTNNSIQFSGQTLTPTAAGVDFLRFVVPSGAVSGPVTVTVGALTTAPRTFTVLEPVIDPIDEITAGLDVGIVTQGLAVLPDGSRGYAVVRDEDEVLPIDLFTLTTGTPIPVGDEPVAAVSTPEGDRVYVANFGDASLSIIDTSSDLVVETIRLPAAPTGLVIAPDGDRVFAITPADSSVHVIDSDTASATYNTVTTSIPCGRGISSAAVSPDGTRLYVGTDNGFLVIGLTETDFGVTTSIPTGRGINSAAVSPDGTLLILVTDANEVQIVDVSPGSSFGVVTSIPTGRGINSAAVSPDGGLLYLLEEGSDQILVVAIEVAGSVSVLPNGTIPLIVTFREVARVDAGDDPAWIAFDPLDPRVYFVGATGDARINAFGRAGIIPVDLEMDLFDPDFDFRARYVTAYVVFPAGYDPHDVDITSVLLNGRIGAVVPRGLFFKDRNGDGIIELAIDFSREDWQREFPVGTDVEVCITGTVGGAPFEGCTRVDNLRPEIVSPVEGDVLMSGTQATIRWQSPAGANVGYVEMYFSRGDGFGDLALQAGLLPDTGSFKWLVPDLPTSIGRVFVALYAADKTPIGAAVTARVGVDIMPVAVSLQDVRLEAQNGDGVLRWTTPLLRGLDGFRVWRAEGEGDYRVVGRLRSLDARVDEGEVEFAFVDQDVVANVDYTYMLEEWREGVSEGEGPRHGPFELRFSVGNALDQNVPNAFNPRTNIRFSVAREGRARLVVYDLRGRVVRTLVDEVLRPDVYTRVWDGTDDRGQTVSSGIYLYRLETDDFVAARKMTLLR